MTLGSVCLKETESCKKKKICLTSVLELCSGMAKCLKRRFRAISSSGVVRRCFGEPQIAYAIIVAVVYGGRVFSGSPPSSNALSVNSSFAATPLMQQHIKWLKNDTSPYSPESSSSLKST